MLAKEIRENFLKFFKARGHTVVPSSSLIPDDPSVLLTTAGMQQFKRYFTGELEALKDFGSKNTVSAQKSFRTSDIDEVGDESHLTFFEMLGNFSFGGYFKAEAIKYAHEFITDTMELPIDYVSVFEGDAEVPADTESEKIWQSLGVTNIKKFGREDNFWGPTGSEGPCGPTTEIYVNSALRQTQRKPSVEVWNIVFNEFYCNSDKSLRKLETPGVDTGMGLERLAMVSQNVPTIFETDLFRSLMESVRFADKKYETERVKRIICDHLRGAVFLINDGVRPSNKEVGYVLRRLGRRVISYGVTNSKDILELIVKQYNTYYPELSDEIIQQVFKEEQVKFSKTVRLGLKELEEKKDINAKTAFGLYQSFGLPYETIKEVGGVKAANLNREEFEKELDAHREISRAGLEKKFGGHGLLLDTGELKAADEEEFQKVLRLHTTTHILQAALRQVLGSGVEQRGSDVNAKRARFDFSFPRKMTKEEKQEVERIMNEIVKKNLPVQFKQLPKEEAERTGALYFFKEKYPDPVKVYYIGDSLETAISKEFCGGPHVERTSQIGKIKIKKEESIGVGVRRIKAVIE
jgi:alanyl-tRNA synthetase